MTHQARAKAIVEKVYGGLVTDAAPDFVQRGITDTAVELIWRELVEACNGELERRRGVEAARDRAMRLQAALEVRNQELQDWLEGLLNIITLEDEPLPDEQLVRARQVLEEFDMSGGSDV